MRKREDKIAKNEEKKVLFFNSAPFLWTDVWLTFKHTFSNRSINEWNIKLPYTKTDQRDFDIQEHQFLS